ncbi:MAG: hypothetical protein QE280_00730 [Caulobacter sp.]|nr:hypothetical protein [Caulobacter sp.]
MDRGQIHYELFVRRQPASGWVLDLAGEDRTRIVESAEDLLAQGLVAAVKVTKEVLDPETREFRSVTILSKGAPDRGKSRKVIEQRDPLCVSPQDLYSGHARERIGRLLDGWLARHRVTPFELMHRADLIERLDASGVELQHAIQKISVPEAQARGVVVHEIIRTFQSLVERTVQRVLKDDRRGAYPDLRKEGVAAAVQRLWSEPERAYLIGGGIARHIGSADGWLEKVNRLLDIADEAAGDPQVASVVMPVIEQPLAEILGGRNGLSNMLGGDLDPGDTLAAITRLAGASAVEALIRLDPRVAQIMPALSGPAERLARWLEGPQFDMVRVALANRVLRELVGPRRLKPGDPEGEIRTLRGLAMALTAADGQVLSMEDIHGAFAIRSGMLVASDFVEALLGHDRSAREEVELLIHLAENVTGGANKRQASRWLSANITGLKFEREFRDGAETPPARLAVLATLQKAVARVGFAQEDCGLLQARLGEIGGLIEADSRLVTLLARAQAPVVHRLDLLLRLAVGEAAPLGPAADRARAEALKLLKAPDLRAEMTRSPETAVRVKGLLKHAGLAA